MSKAIKTDLDLMIAAREHEDALLAAKKGKDPDKARKVKDEVRAFRQEWREVREAFGGGGAAPATVGMKAKG